jgi:hypothetical protein
MQVLAPGREEWEYVQVSNQLFRFLPLTMCTLEAEFVNWSTFSSLPPASERLCDLQPRRLSRDPLGGILFAHFPCLEPPSVLDFCSTLV